MTTVIGLDEPPAELRTTPLDALHRAHSARMVPFAGYSMPVQYAPGILAESRQCRERAALFDVSHMGQAWLIAAPGAPAAALERLVPGDIQGLKPWRQRYTLLLNEAGGIRDDLMVANASDDGSRLLLVVNASRKQDDFDHIAAALPPGIALEPLEDRALLAVQGPQAAAVLGRLAPQAAALRFMAVAALTIEGAEIIVSRSGYTGEDGFEISVPAAQAEAFAARLLEAPEMAPAGLGARDALRLEAGLCLYGNDIDELTTPVEAGLTWTIGKRRRRDWDFPGAVAIRDQLDNGPHRLRVGLRPEGRAPARAATQIAAADGTDAGSVTSGGFSPSLEAPIAMGYVRRDLATDGTAVLLLVRGRQLPASVVPMPFVPHRYLS
ncbi:MAG: glycine cleavage system aminomethyltransferase GcvT [Acidisphaera sp.]|nr:glycine cleavage system aminomethyltransferase GcvT [Acidisphaera sp.]